MYPYYVRLLHGSLSPSSHELTLCGYNGVSSKMSERHRDTEPDIDRPELVGVWTDGQFVIGEEDGDSGEWIAAETTVEIEDAT
jgi:hypothetical protein